MKRILVILAALAVSFVSFAEIPENAVLWTASASKVDGGVWRISVVGEIQEGLHIYDTRDYEYGANPTVITVEGAELLGELRVISPVENHFEDVLGFEIGTISGRAEFVQEVKAKGGETLHVDVEWMCCSDNECSMLQDKTLVVKLPKEGKDPIWWLGFVVGLLLGLGGVALGYKFAKTKQK